MLSHLSLPSQSPVKATFQGQPLFTEWRGESTPYLFFPDELSEWLRCYGDPTTRGGLVDPAYIREVLQRGADVIQVDYLRITGPHRWDRKVVRTFTLSVRDAFLLSTLIVSGGLLWLWIPPYLFKQPVKRRRRRFSSPWANHRRPAITKVVGR